MNRDALLSTLRCSLEDRRLSRDERRTLQELLGTQALDQETRAFLRNRVFEVAQEALHQDPGVDSRLLLRWCQDAIKSLEAGADSESTQTEVLFSPGETCLHAITNLIERSQRSIDICVFTITDDRISERIIKAAERGLTVRIISDNDKAEDRGSDIESLRRQGLSVRVDRSEHHMHHKFALFDDEKVLTGSYNWTRSAAKHNRENLLICNDPDALRGYRGEFEQLWAHLA